MTMAGMMRAITEIIDQDSIIAEFDDAETLSNTTSTETTMKMMINGNQIVQKGLTASLLFFGLFMIFILTLFVIILIKCSSQCLACDCVHDHFQVTVTQIVKHWQAQQLVTDLLGHRAIARFSTEFDTHLRKMKRKVVKDSLDIGFLECVDQFLPFVQIRQKHIEHVIRLITVSRNYGQTAPLRFCPGLQFLVIELPNMLATRLNFFPVFKLGVEEGSQNIRWQIG